MEVTLLMIDTFCSSERRSTNEKNLRVFVSNITVSTIHRRCTDDSNSGTLFDTRKRQTNLLHFFYFQRNSFIFVFVCIFVGEYDFSTSQATYVLY